MYENGVSGEQQGISHKGVCSQSSLASSPFGWTGFRTPHFLPTLLQPPPLLPVNSTANPSSSFLWPKGLTQRARPNTCIWHKGISPSGPPPTPIASPRYTSCAVSTLNLSPCPGRLDLSQCRALPPLCPGESYTFFSGTLATSSNHFVHLSMNPV